MSLLRRHPRGSESRHGVPATDRDRLSAPDRVSDSRPDARVRESEERGQIVDDIRGMPLGLPALSPAQIQLVETWIAQGRPQ